MSESAEKIKTQDLFDKLDIFDIIDLPKFKSYEAPPRVSISINDEIRTLIKAEIASHLKRNMAAIVAEVKPERVIHTKEMVSPPERVIVKEVDVKAMEKAIAERLKSAMLGYEKNWKNIAPIVVPNGIANMEGQGGKVLSTDGRLTKWIANTGGGGSVSSDIYHANNVTTTRTFDATNTSIDELASVLGSLIISLQTAGILQ